MADSASLNRTTVYTVLSGITLLGIVLRLYHLNYQSLWYDELHSIIPTNPNHSLSSVIEYSKSDQPPAFFVYLYFFFKLFGYNEVTGRFASAIIGIAGIPVMFLFGKEINGERVGLAAALLASLNYMHIYYSQELRFYSMAFLFSALSFLFLIRAYKRGKVIDFLFYIVFTTALLYTHYYGLVIYCAQVVIFSVLLRCRRNKNFILRAFCSGVLILILFMPWMPVILSDLEITSFWLQRPAATFIADYFYYYFGKDVLVTTAFVVLTLLFFKDLLDNESGKERRIIYLVLLIWLLVSYLIPYVKSIIGPPMLHVRYTIVTLPVWFLIFSLGWSRIKSIRWQYAVITLIGLSMLLNLLFVRRHYIRIDKQQFREVSQFIKRMNASGIPVYSQYPWHFNFYFRNHPIEIVNLNSSDLPKTDVFWLLHAEFFSDDERNQVLSILTKDFEIVEAYPFHKTEALLLKRAEK